MYAIRSYYAVPDQAETEAITTQGAVKLFLHFVLVGSSKSPIETNTGTLIAKDVPAGTA